MRSPRCLVVLMVLSLTAGCGGDPVVNPDHASPVLNPGPHRGALRRINGTDGFIEVVTEPVRDAPSGSPKFRVAVYFLDPSQTAPLRSIPTGVVLQAAWPDAPTAQTIPLTMAPVPGDPTGMAKFVAPPADHQGEPTGTLAAHLGDQEITAPL